MAVTDSTLYVLFTAQHKLIVANLETKSVQDVSLEFPWTSDGLIDSMNVAQTKILLISKGKVTVCGLKEQGLCAMTEMKGDQTQAALISDATVIQFRKQKLQISTITEGKILHLNPFQEVNYCQVISE